MPVLDRRSFVGKAAATPAAIGADSWIARVARAQTAASSRARLVVDPARTIASLDRNLFGSFLEHLGRAVYGGVYEPGSKLADGSGFARDVLEEVRRLGVPIVRYPGGNFVSGYDWRDGVGPTERAPAGPGAGLELRRDEPVRYQRVRCLVPGGGSRAAARHQLRHRGRRDVGCSRGVLQRREGHALE